ncbi:MAG TPA: hypothetical protein VJO35_03130 [Terriglobales bacterium]|nr:hypothetical protein [Terriglobales bacterium]
MLSFAETAERIAATTKKLEKTALLAEYFKSVRVEQAAVAAVFFSGRPFPSWEETTLQVGGRLLWSIVEELSGKNDHELTAAYRKFGDLGAVAGELLPGGHRGPSPHAPGSVQVVFREIAAARGPSAKGILVRKLLSEISPLQAKYVVKIMTGDLRIGLKENLVEEAIAKAFGGTLAQVQRANMLLGDMGETLRLAAQNRLDEAKMRLFHPIGFMLASPAESADDALSYFKNAWVEDKYDGIRAQAHCSGGTVRFFSRTRDEITESFPELPEALAGLPQDAILDGEILAWSYLADEGSDARESAGEDVGAPFSGGYGRALPFSALQQRLGRKKVSEKLMRDVPIAYLVFDVLYAHGELVIDKPLRERARILNQLLADRKAFDHEAHEGTRGKGQVNLAFGSEAAVSSAEVIRAPLFHASSPDELNRLFDAAQARGNEGLMIKDPESPYTPGRRGKSWLKLKRELATLDVVVTAVEYGHGRRIAVLSDYTFAVRDGDRLLNIGKAYSGLTDAEILEMTKWFTEHTIEDQGFRRVVEPKVVLEVAFNNIMKSDRHSSGYALRFPRIVRFRPDKLPEEADTLERATEIFTKQNV